VAVITLIKTYILIYYHSLLYYTEKMVKAVALLGSSEGVKGTIYFTQEGEGMLYMHRLVLGNNFLLYTSSEIRDCCSCNW
jgi:hypothetical protein